MLSNIHCFILFSWNASKGLRIVICAAHAHGHNLVSSNFAKNNFHLHISLKSCKANVNIYFFLKSRNLLKQQNVCSWRANATIEIHSVRVDFSSSNINVWFIIPYSHILHHELYNSWTENEGKNRAKQQRSCTRQSACTIMVNSGKFQHKTISNIIWLLVGQQTDCYLN